MAALLAEGLQKKVLKAPPPKPVDEKPNLSEF
jgi:hypothetical protein